MLRSSLTAAGISCHVTPIHNANECLCYEIQLSVGGEPGFRRGQQGQLATLTSLTISALTKCMCRPHTTKQSVKKCCMQLDEYSLMWPEVPCKGCIEFLASAALYQTCWALCNSPTQKHPLCQHTCCLCLHPLCQHTSCLCLDNNTNTNTAQYPSRVSRWRQAPYPG
jgi:hypothetical protein